jgi:methyltransferase (TIGR00027 family)
MKKGEASRTAAYMALFRALETTRATSSRLFEDPLASVFLTPALRLAVHLSRIRPIGSLLRAYIDRRWPGARTSAVARTRFIDDAARSALRAGVMQVVILGSGYDARPYRIAGMERTTVFEVDDPSTSARKQRALEAVFGALPRHVQFVPMDFNVADLSSVMGAASYDRSQRTLFTWEGVTNYLTEAAVDATLRFCARAAVGSVLIFTYVDRRVIESPETFFGTSKLFSTLNAADERWTFGLDPTCLPRFLAERGLVLDEDVGASDYRAIHYGPSSNRMKGYEFYRIAVARIAPRA